MYIRSLKIEQYRGIKKLELHFQKGINVLIGRNNSGKTAIIDALRLCLQDRRPESRRGIYFNHHKDFYVDIHSKPIAVSKESAFTITLESSLSKEEQVIINAIENPVEKQDKARELKLNSEAEYYHLAYMNDDSTGITFSFTLRYYLDITTNGEEKLRSEVLVGQNLRRRIPTEAWDAFYAVYLQPLRDAVAALQPPFSKLGEHLDVIGGTADQKAQHAKNIHDKMKTEPGWMELIDEASTNIRDDHLKKMTLRSMSSAIKIGFLPSEFRRIADQLRVRFPYVDEAEFDDNYFEVDQNGLGFNNLVFASTVLANLSKRSEEYKNSSSFLLIEEPEAHLHPQAQSQFFSYLNTLSGDNCQVFISSHSPTVTAKTDLQKIIVIESSPENNIQATHLVDLCPIENENNDLIENSESTLSPGINRMSGDDKDFLEKFMDVTKSQLYFAEGVIYVEGYSEALCMNVFAKRIGIDLTKEGIEVINIQGISFSHFIQLHTQNGLKKPFAVVTDKDETKRTGSGRINNLRTALTFEPEALCISDNENFEDTIYNDEANQSLLDDIYAEIRSENTPTVDSATEVEGFHNNAESFAKKIDSLEYKTELALRLSRKLAEPEVQFVVPVYIQKAIRRVASVNGPDA